MHSNIYLVDHLLFPVVLWIFIVASIVGIALGVCLNIQSDRTMRFLGSMNRWISVRKSLKPMEEPHDIGEAVYRRRRWFGSAFAISGAFVIYMLLFKVRFASLAVTLSEDWSPVMVELIIDSLTSLLVAGGILALAIGVMLVFAPNALRALETRVDRWYSPRELGKGGVTMRLTLDQWVQAYPRISGALIALGSTLVLIAWLMVLLGR